MSFEAIPSFLKPRLRLFLSVDLVGSTALKQSGDLPLKKPQDDETLGQAGAKWIIDLANFYREIEAKFSKEVLNYCKVIGPNCRWPTSIAPRLWKVNGDELIYVAEIDSSRECVAIITCWYKACLSFRAELHTKKSKLDVKMSAWTAGFPITNTEVIFKSSASRDSEDWQPEVLHYKLIDDWYRDPANRGDMVQDFIGPSLDTGFRVASKASPRKFMLCLELAYIIATVVSPPAVGKLKLRYDGQDTLKGVLGNKPYPLFWIDTHTEDALSNSEDKLTGQGALEHEKVHDFCSNFLGRHEAYLLKPFIDGDSEPMFSIVPENYCEKVSKLADVYNKARASRDAYLASVVEDDKPDEPSDVGAVLRDFKVPLQQTRDA